jgi:hypothetical protein
MDGLQADVARLALGVLRARFRRHRDGRRVLRIRVVLLGAATSLNLLADFVMAAFFPVLRLASGSAVARFAAAALLGKVRERRSAAGAVREDHVYAFL